MDKDFKGKFEAEMTSSTFAPEHYHSTTVVTYISKQ